MCTHASVTKKLIQQFVLRHFQKLSLPLPVFPKTKLTGHFNMSMTPLIFLNQLPQQPSLSTRHDHWMTDKMTS